MTTVSSGNISSTSLVTQAYLNITQSITQGVLGEQLINVECKKNTSACNKCIAVAKQYGLGDRDNYSKICNVCFCTLENVNMNNIITIDFSAFTSTDQTEEFKQQIQNSLTQQASISGTTLFDTSDVTLNALNKTSSDMYNAMKQSSFQNSLQELKNFQILSLNNPNSSVINVDLDLTVDFISKILQQNKTTSSMLDKFDKSIVQITTQTVQGALTIVISWIVTLFVIAIIVAFFIFGISIVMQVFELYAST